MNTEEAKTNEMESTAAVNVNRPANATEQDIAERMRENPSRNR